MSTVAPRTFPLTRGGTVLVRSVREDDAAALLRHGQDVMRTSPHTVTLPEELAARDEAWERNWIREHLDGDGSLVLIAEIDGRIVGALNFKNHPRKRMAHHGHFGIGVDQAWRGRGIGRALITTLLDWAREHPVVEKVCLGVFANNVRAQKLYLDMGFREEGRRVGEFKMGPGIYVDDIQMSMWVKPRESRDGPA